MSVAHAGMEGSRKLFVEKEPKKKQRKGSKRTKNREEEVADGYLLDEALG